jgi:hypothetical protein
MKSGNLNFLEPSGPLQACNGTALPLPLPYCSTYLLPARYTALLYEAQQLEGCNLFCILVAELSRFDRIAYPSSGEWRDYGLAVGHYHFLSSLFSFTKL